MSSHRLPPGVISLKAERERRDADPSNLPFDGELYVAGIPGHPGWARIRLRGSDGDVSAVLDPDALSGFMDMLADIEQAGPNAPTEGKP